MGKSTSYTKSHSGASGGSAALGYNGGARRTVVGAAVGSAGTGSTKSGGGGAGPVPHGGTQDGSAPSKGVTFAKKGA